MNCGLFHILGPVLFILVFIVCRSCSHAQSEIGSKEIWRVSSVPKTNDFKALLAPFHPISRAWGADSLAYSDKHPGALAVHYAKGSYSGKKHNKGGAFYSTPSELGKQVDDLILMYDVYFENFGWGLKGKLPGLFGGEDGEGAYKCSGGNNPSTCFTLRLAWRKNGEGEVYAYISDHQAPGFDERKDVRTNYKYGHSLGRGKISFRNGEWQTVMEQVHLNSRPDLADGYVKMCVLYRDGSKQCYTVSNLVIRKSSKHHLRGFVFSTFFGGGSKEDAAPNDCHAYFKNFKLKYPSSDVHVE